MSIFSRLTSSDHDVRLSSLSELESSITVNGSIRSLIDTSEEDFLKLVDCLLALVIIEHPPYTPVLERVAALPDYQLISSYVSNMLICLQNRWHRLDWHRMNKIYYFIRVLLLHATQIVFSSSKGDMQAPCLLSLENVFRSCIFSPEKIHKGIIAFGILNHVCDIYLELLESASEDQRLFFLQPVVDCLASPLLVDSFSERIRTRIIYPLTKIQDRSFFLKLFRGWTEPQLISIALLDIRSGGPEDSLIGIALTKACPSRKTMKRKGIKKGTRMKRGVMRSKRKK